ncbi:MAG: hypothetical protein M5U14_15535 [Acidimicrobiia bacterium]|nr:hypothetical protein [Acidimicrobiia bacterium]
MRGTSAWQCGHQWARKTTTWGRPVAPPAVTAVPSKDSPSSSGAAVPTASSATPWR